jgi:hypothetical protein
MPAVVKFDRQRKRVFSASYGEVADQELLPHRSAIAANPISIPNSPASTSPPGHLESTLVAMESVFSESVLTL